MLQASWERFRRLARALGWGSWQRYDLLGCWRRNRQVAMNGGLELFRQELLVLRDVVVDPARRHHRKNAGRDLVELETGFLQREGSADGLLAPDWLGRCLASLTAPHPGDVKVRTAPLEVLVRRVEWQNLYHTLAEITQAFLAAEFLGYAPERTRILFADAHPPGPFHLLWERVFESAQALDVQPCLYPKLAVCQVNQASPLTPCLGPAPPHLEKLSRRLRDPLEKPPCEVTIVSRENCRERRLANEKELAGALEQSLSGLPVRLVRLEELSLNEQLQTIARTRLLVGAHGAGLAFSLLLPPGSAVLEIFPGFLQAFRFHFLNIARWRCLPYGRWINFAAGDPATPVSVPVALIASKARALLGLA